MKKILKLYRMISRSGSSGNTGSGHKANENQILTILLAVLFTGFLGYAGCRYADTIALLSGAPMLLMICGIVASVVMICYGFFTLINAMYMSSDIEILITLPFSSTEIAVLRVLPMLQLAMAGTICAVFAPLIGYSLTYPVEASEWIGAAFTALLTPVFVLSVVACIVIVLMSFLKIFRNRNTLRVIGVLFLFAAYCGYLYISGGSDTLTPAALLESAAKLTGIVKYFIPPVGFVTKFLMDGNALYLGAAVLCTAAAAVLFYFVAKVLYLQGALNMQDAGSGKVLNEEELRKSCRKKKPLASLMAKEYRMVRRNPAYLLSNFIFGLFWPALVLLGFQQMIPIVKQMMGEGLATMFSGPLNLASFELLGAVLSFLMIVIVSFPLMQQSLSSSCLSREGNDFYIMKQLPVSYQVQLEAKRSMAEGFEQVIITGYSFLILLAVSFLMKFSFVYCIFPLVMVMLYCKLCVNTDMYLGIRNADVSWDDEKKAAQKPTAAIVIDLIYAGLLAVIGVKLGMGVLEDTLSMDLCFIITAAVGVAMGIASLVLWKMIMSSGEKKIRRLRF